MQQLSQRADEQRDSQGERGVLILPILSMLYDVLEGFVHRLPRAFQSITISSYDRIATYRVSESVKLTEPHLTKRLCIVRRGLAPIERSSFAAQATLKLEQMGSLSALSCKDWRSPAIPRISD